MEQTNEGSHHTGESAHELEAEQLLSPTSPEQARANSIRSQNASISDLSDQSILISGNQAGSVSSNENEPISGNSNENDSVSSNDDSSVTSNANTGSWSSHGSPQWTPFALRWYFIMVPATLVIVCTIVVATLYWRSHKNNGLGPESSAMPGWKFVPTLIAVIYTQLTSMILGAMKRTEPFARLAKPSEHIPVSRYTLLEKSKPWWTTLSHSFQKKRNGGSRNWALMASSMVYISAILGISPISAALLGSKEVRQANSETFVRLAVRNNPTLRPRADRDTYLQTTSAIFQNYSTSPWITDEYLVLPFWHSGLPQGESPWNYRSLQTNIWEANTTVFRNDFVCTDLHLSKKDVIQDNKTQLASVLLVSDDGCHYNLTVPMSDPLMARYWMSWGDAHVIMDDLVYNHDAIVRLNEECSVNETILLSTPWWAHGVRQPKELVDNLTVRAYACHTDYTMAIIPVRVTGTSEKQSVQFDDDLFRRMRTPIGSAMIDPRDLHNIYTDVTWDYFIPQEKNTEASQSGRLTGPSAMLGRRYNFSIPAMIADPDLLTHATRFRRRFFAEIISTTLQHNSTSVSEQQYVAGVSYAPTRQVLVSGPAASALCTLLMISLCALLGIMWWGRPTTRKLGLYCDPSMVLGVSLWASGNVQVLSDFKALDLATRQSLKENLTGRIFSTDNGWLHELRPPYRTKTIPATLTLKDTASILPDLRLRKIACLLLYIIGLLTGMAVLFQFARRSKLHQAFFTYQANIKLFGNANNISPFAIVPTVFAVVIALWWDSVDTTCRSAQPYVSMYRGAKRPLDSIGLSYASSFWLWASFDALKNRHWLLSLVTATTFLIHIFTITMSALFDLGTGNLASPWIVSPILELRQVPLIQIDNSAALGSEWTGREGMQGPLSIFSHQDLLTGDFFNLKADWMNPAVIQDAYNGPAPTWSKDDWNFVPVFLTLEDLLSIQDLRSQFQDAAVPANLTVQTPAIRITLDCSVIEAAKNTSNWFPQREPYDNSTGLDVYYNFDATMFDDLNDTQITRVTAQGTSPHCCGNVTDDTVHKKTYDPAVVAYWTENWLSNGSNAEPGGNFTIKWIRGPAGFVENPYSTIDSLLFFSEAPVMQALNCVPGFEASKAEVLVDLKSGVVHDYRILSKPVPDNVAWSDSWTYRNLSQIGLEEILAPVNVTTSYGNYFMRSLLRAACLDAANMPLNERRNMDDNPWDKVFNMRDNSTGVNMDFMSYAAYAQVKFDPLALLDADVLLNTSRKVLSTFFQNFVNNNVTRKDGGYVYQPAGLQVDLAPPMGHETYGYYTPKGDIAPKYEDVHRNTNKTITATLSTHIEMLHINPVAFWIATSILIWLIIVIIIFASVQRKYYGGMMRNVECIADVLVLIAGSERLLAVIKEKGIDTILKENKILTRLGWFRDPDGMMRWRIELVEDEQQMQLIQLGSSNTPVLEDEDTEEGGAPLPVGEAQV